MKNIVLTGGPCAGKTTALAALKECLEERGYKVFILSESATILINQGIKPFGENAISMYEFQKIIASFQLKREAIIRAKAKLFKKSIIIYDRGLIDNKAYLDEISWNRLVNELNLNERNLMNRYDMAIHLVTAAEAKEGYYTTDNNTARSESVYEAIERDTNTLNAYVGHHNLKVVGNYTKFEEKINQVKNCILSELNEPAFLNNQYKFLIDLSQSNLEKIKANSVKSYIEQTYLKSEEHIDKKIRKKVIDGKTSYYLIVKTKNNEREEIKISRVISKLEYLYYLKMRDETRECIKKLRYSFRVDKEVYNLDVFAENNWAILENETTKNFQDLILPDFLSVVDVTFEDYNNLRNKTIAKRRTHVSQKLQFKKMAQ